MQLQKEEMIYRHAYDMKVKKRFLLPQPPITRDVKQDEVWDLHQYNTLVFCTLLLKKKQQKKKHVSKEP